MATEKILLGLDIGTQGAKGVLINSSGQIVSSKYRSYRTYHPAPGWAEQDPEDWWQAIVWICRELGRKGSVQPSQIAAVGCCAQAPDVILADSKGHPIRNAIIWEDRRSVGESESLKQKCIHLGRSEAVDSISPQSFAPPFMWLINNEPEAIERAAVALPAPTYLLYRLTGATVVDEANALGMRPFYDPHLNSWDTTFCKALGVPLALFPDRITTAREIVGNVSETAAEETGLLPGTPVITGMGDMTAEMISVGLVEDGQMAFVYATIFALLKCIKKPSPDALAIPHAFPGRWLQGDGVVTSGALTQWFRNQFAANELEAESTGGINAYQRLAVQSKQIPPGSGGLLFLPFFSGDTRILRNSLSGGSILGLTLSHSRMHIYRAMLEGIAYEVRRLLGRFTPLPDVIRAMGGGTRNMVWTQIISDVTGLQQQVATLTSGAPLGAAYLAGMSVGLIENINPLVQFIESESHIVRPIPSNQLVYEEGFRKYLIAIDGLGLAGI
jgi:xylulokinase